MQRSEPHGPGEGLKAGRFHRKGAGRLWNILVLSGARGSLFPVLCSYPNELPFRKNLQVCPKGGAPGKYNIGEGRF